MKLAYVYDALHPYTLGGAERRYFELAKRLKARHEVHFISWKHWDGDAKIEADGVTFHGVGRPPRFYGADGKRTVSEGLSFAAAIVPVLARERFDVIDCCANPFLSLISCRAVTRPRKTPLVATWHEFWGPHWRSYMAHRPAVARVAAMVEAAAVRRADSIISVSEFTAARLAGRKHPDQELSVIGNGIDVEFIDAIEPAMDSAEIVYLGRLIEDKRVDLVLRALAGRGPSIDARFDVIGDGPELPALRRLADDLGLAQRVRFFPDLGENEALARLKGARVFAMPSIREGFGISVIEAMACGLVPVVTNAPHNAAQHLVEHGKTGLVTDPSAESIAGALGALLGDNERRAEMAEGALANARLWDWSLAATRVEQAYLRAMRRTAATGLQSPIPAELAVPEEQNLG